MSDDLTYTLQSVAMLREKGYAEYDVQRIAKKLVSDLVKVGCHVDKEKIEERQKAVFKHFVAFYIVREKERALLNEAVLENEQSKQ